MHQQMVSRVSLAAGHLGHPRAVRHGGHSGIADERIDLPAFLEEQVDELHEEHSAGRGDYE